ncbi:MAG TPA: single-stranded-DNA-specific exonuclease RecJ [Dehalococcoidia bacterium]|nr:single-stranded-DNA-specific exonuclease RecJ [Dehalococcoidia bacterium]
MTAPAFPPARGRRRWRLRPAPRSPGRLAHLGLPPLIAKLLELRGITSAAEARVFLGGSDLPRRDPFLLPGLDAAVRRLRDAVRNRDPVAVYGDFDVDGITSTATLTESINDLGGVARPYIPNREREGYGLNVAAIEALAAAGTRLLVTCDCGTTNVLEVERARQLGVDVIVVDHHTPPAALPPATALVNPKLPTSAYPFTEYATAGLAYRLAGVLYEACGRPFPAGHYLDLAALGTVADLVPLVDENRDIVRRGLAAIASTSRPGVAALLRAAGIAPKEVSSQAIAYALAPRLNAAGRLEDASAALELLMTPDEARADELAARLDVLNRERQDMTRAAEALAREMTEGLEAPLTFVGSPGFHQGIVGLVASKLVESFGRPAVVFHVGETHSRGSCRSIADYDIVSGLRACADLFDRFGGHRQAGGFTIRNDRLPELRDRLLEHAGRALAGVELGPSVDIDAEWELGRVRGHEIKWLSRLQPHGMANPDPTLLSRRVQVLESWTVGEDGRHLRLKLKDGPVTWSGILFNWEQEAPAAGSLADVVYSFAGDRYGPVYADGGKALQLTLEDLAPAG